MSISTRFNSSPEDLPVYLTIDVGPTDAVMGHGHAAAPSWEVTFQGLESLFKTIPFLEQQIQRALPVTWFVRADRFIHHQFGNRLAIINRFLDNMGKLIHDDGHELGWMPQLPSGQANGIMYEDLLNTCQAVRSIVPTLNSVRMGDCYHDNTSMQVLNQLGIRFDSSALPGRVKHDAGWCMDWQKTPQFAYHPCHDDYRLAGHPAMDILEVPLSVAPILAPYDSVALLRYLNPCYGTDIWSQGFNELIATAPYMVLILHPDELVSRNTPGHPLVSYSQETLINNILNMIDRASLLGRKISFQTIGHFNPANQFTIY